MTEEFEGLDLVGLLDLLEPTPEPPAIAMTPQTPGWIVVGVLLVAILLRQSGVTPAQKLVEDTRYLRGPLSDTVQCQDELKVVVERLLRSLTRDCRRRWFIWRAATGGGISRSA